MDKVEEIYITIDENDTIETISGIVGEEFVYLEKIDKLLLVEIELNKFKIEIGVMDY